MERHLSGRVDQCVLRVDQCVLRWFRHVERIDEERMAKKVMNSNVEGNRCRGRPRLGKMNSVKRAFK